MENHGHEIIATVHETAHAASHGAPHAAHEMHELPNWITLLGEKFPHNPFVHFLHQWENVVFTVSIALIISFVAISAARKKSLIPEGAQNFCEAVVEGLEGFVTGILGSHGKKHVPYLGTMFLFILLNNWLGLFPFMKSATSAWSTTLAIALTTMVYVQITGVREQGLKHYIFHLMGNPQGIIGFAVVPLMLVLNIILEFGAVPFSLSLRLFANISSEDRLLLNFAQLALSSDFLAFPFQLFANLLAIIFSLVQAFVFMLLSTVYIALVLPHEDHGHEEHPQTLSHAH